MRFPHTHTTTKKYARKKYAKKRELPQLPQIPEIPALPGAILLGLSLFVLAFVIVFTTSPQNLLFVILFFASIGGGLTVLFRTLKLSLLSAFFISLTIVSLGILRISQMANILNIVLVVAIGICFISFTKDRK